MARAFNLIILFAFISLMLWMGGQVQVGTIPANFSQQVDYYNRTIGVTGKSATFYNLFPATPSDLTLVSGIISATVLIGTIFFPNPYTIFLTATSILVTFYLGFQDLFNTLGFPSQVLAVIGVIGLGFLLYILGFYKGNE